MSVDGRVEVPDITEGKEMDPVPAINTIDDQLLPPLEYSAEAIPQGGIVIPKVGLSPALNVFFSSFCTGFSNEFESQILLDTRDEY